MGNSTHLSDASIKLDQLWPATLKDIKVTNEQSRGKTNVVSEQVRHKPACTATEAGYKLEILELSRGGIVLSE